MENEKLTIDEVVACKLEELEELTYDDDQYKIAAEAAVALQKALNEQRKIEREYDIELKKLKLEVQKLKQEKLIHDEEQAHAKKETWINAAVGVVGVAVPAILYGALFNKGLRFEQTGTVTSGFVRNLIGKIRPTK